VIRALAVIAAVALAPGAALADDSAEHIAERGFAAYDRGEYATAISYFEQAYDKAPAPGLLYNIAQAYRKLGTSGCERALEYYERYRDALAEAGKPVGEGLRARIVEMESCVGTGESEPELEPEPQPQIALTAEPPASPRRRAGWILVIGGAAAGATAIVTGALALDRESDLNAQCENEVCPPALEGRVRGYDRLRFAAFASGAVGAAAVATGAYLLWSSQRPESAKATSVQPVVGRGTIGVRCEF
jgi:tetratricopeptide (TPR) repeat protein